MKLWLRFGLLAMVSSTGLAQTGTDAELARDAHRFAFPVAEMMRVRANLEALAAARGRSIVNRIAHRPTLTKPADRTVTAPNNDTLYSSGWLDLAAGPVLLTIPPLPDRYHSVALLDLFTDNQAVLGTRVNGGGGGTYLIAGPGWKGRAPDAARLVRMPVNDLWVIVRVLVDGPADLAFAVAAQAGFTVEPLAKTPLRAVRAPASDTNDPRAFLAIVNEALGRGPLPPEQARRAPRFARAGIRPGNSNAWNRLSAAMRTAWQANMTRFNAEIKGGLENVGTRVRGWVYPKAGMGRFGSDDMYRTRVALAGLGALPVEEAIYVTTDMDGAGRPLDGRSNYRLRLPAKIPVAGFWSISMYKPEADGRMFFIDNALDRYAIGNRTPGLSRTADGGVDLLVGAARPASGAANWLPAPAGPFRLTFRAYLPEEPFRRGTFRLPPVERMATP